MNIGMLTVLAPITPGHEDRLQAYLNQFTTADSPFASIDGVHVARCVVIGPVRRDYRGAPRVRRRLRMNYLLFTAVFDGLPESFLRRMHESMASSGVEIWAHCVDYPGLRSPQFESYLEHHTLPIGQRYAAYDASVAEVRHAMTLRRKHTDFALARSGKAAAQLLADFRTEFEV